MVQIKGYILQAPPNEQTSACKASICGSKLPEPQPENAASLGHSTPQTTLNIYTHCFQEQRMKAMGAVAEMIGFKRKGSIA